MTSKQKWFLEKLMNEIEKEADYEFLGHETNYGSKGYDFYMVTTREASDDIDMLLKIKANVENGMTFQEARQDWLDKYFYPNHQIA